MPSPPRSPSTSSPRPPALPLDNEALSQRLGERLLEAKLIGAVELAYVSQKQKVLKQQLWQLVLKEGLVAESKVAEIIGELLHIPFRHIEHLPRPDARVLAMFNMEICSNAQFLPLTRDASGVLLIALGGGLPQEVAQEVFTRTSLRCEFVQTTFSALKRLTKNVYYFEKNPPEELVQREIAALSNDPDLLHPPARFVEHLLHWAVQARATDIHLSAGPSTKHVLFRIDGVLQPMCALPSSLGRVLSYIKLTSDMDISEQRRPQDGSFRMEILDAALTVRVSTIVTEHGERMVMRLLPETQEVKDLRSLGYLEDDIQTITRAMDSPAGLVLITGPTGSGKSSTLHAGLCMQHLIERSVLTVEDPLEYRVHAAAQTEVNRRAGYDFGTALRHFLRHDPDVILVGEMRDAETAQAAFEAAATGHLVLSTLHVTGVFGVVPRLRPMGLLPGVIAENLLLIINQRLVRKVCDSCAQEVDFDAAELAWLAGESHADIGSDNAEVHHAVAPPRAKDLDPHAVQHDSIRPREHDGGLQPLRGRRGAGCERCRYTGFLGRLPLYEMLPVNTPMANAIADDLGREAIRTLAKAQGFRGIAHVARHRVRCGQTTMQEVFRVIGDMA